MPDDLYSQPLLTMSDVNRLLARIERTRKHLICASDVYERVRDAVYGAGFGIAYRVVRCPWLDDGQVLLGPSDEELDEMLQVPFGGRGEATATGVVS